MGYATAFKHNGKSLQSCATKSCRSWSPPDYPSCIYRYWSWLLAVKIWRHTSLWCAHQISCNWMLILGTQQRHRWIREKHNIYNRMIKFPWQNLQLSRIPVSMNTIFSLIHMRNVPELKDNGKHILARKSNEYCQTKSLTMTKDQHESRPLPEQAN